jgi:hypothetical protein
MSLVEAGWYYGKNELSMSSAVLNSMHPEYAWFFLNGVSVEPYTCGYHFHVVYLSLEMEG